jgi:hypothetical protein
MTSEISELRARIQREVSRGAYYIEANCVLDIVKALNALEQRIEDRLAAIEVRLDGLDERVIPRAPHPPLPEQTLATCGDCHHYRPMLDADYGGCGAVDEIDLVSGVYSHQAACGSFAWRVGGR